MSINKYDIYIFDLFDVIVPWLETFVKYNYYYNFLLNFNHEELRKWNISYINFLEEINNIHDFNIEELILNIFSKSIPDNELIKILKILKENNKRIILISDTYKEINNHLLNNYNFFELFDDIYLSCSHWKTKKSWKLFDELIKDWINPKKSIYIDDSNKNILYLKDKWFNTHQYKDINLLKDFLFKNNKI